MKLRGRGFRQIAQGRSRFFRDDAPQNRKAILSMISVENLTKGFGPRILFENVGFKINPQERVGLVGRNGHGKTTLFRILVGAEQPDAGTVTLPKNYRIGYVQQQIAFTEATILAEGMTALPTSDSGQAWKVEKILAGLGFSEADLQRPPTEFSGGYQVRLNLAKVLLSEPDLLLLDEPTNYLDIAAIRWVERFLSSWPRELLLITHDRGFMDRVITQTLGIHRKKIRKVPGDTGKYYAQIAQEEEVHEKTRINDERKRKQVEQFISRFRAKARLAGMVQSRIKTLEKMGRKEKLESVEDLEFSFRSRPFAGKQVFSVRDLTFSYDGSRPLIDGLSLSAGPGERICIVGKNGRGKTTLLRLLAGTLTPGQGEISYNPQVQTGIFEQTHIASLVESRTVEEEIMAAHPDVDRQSARNICGAMMFSGDDALKRISVLSGGEKSRVMLGRLLATPVNLLLLDEPTNHLDMESCDALLAAVDSFEGVVVMVTHNEMFLHALAQRLIVFQRGGVQVFEGDYQEFLDREGWEDEEPGHSTPGGGGKPEGGGKIGKKQFRKLRSKVITERSRELRPLEKAIAAAEDQIEAREQSLAALNRDMQEASETGDGPRIAELSRSIHRFEEDLEGLFSELERLTAECGRRQAEYDQRLAVLERQQSP